MEFPTSRQDSIYSNYERKPFKLDGRMDLEISFGEKTMMTPMYIKMDAKDPLLLSEGVCHQLGIITYHPDVQVWHGGRKCGSSYTRNPIAKVPAVRVRLVGGVSVSPTPATLTNPEDYREELVLSLSSARELTVKSIQSPQSLRRRGHDDKQKRQSLKTSSSGGWG